MPARSLDRAKRPSEWSLDQQPVALSAEQKFQAEGFSAVDRALSVIEILGDLPEGLTLSDLAKRLDVNKAIAHRLVATLEVRNYVFRHELSGRLHLTYKVSNLGLRRLAQNCLLDQSSVILRGLADATGELARLAVVEGNRITWVAAATGMARALQVDASYSLRIALHAHAAGKAWLATLPFDQALSLLVATGLPALTPQTLTRVEDIRADLETIATRGYAISFEEHSIGVGAVAVPVSVRQVTGQSSCVGTISLAAPTARLGRADLEGLSALLSVAAGRLAERWPLEQREVAAVLSPRVEGSA